MISENNLTSADYLQIDVSADNSELLFYLDEKGFKPVSYLPNFNNCNDLVEMVKIKDDFELPNIEDFNFSEKPRKIAEYVLNYLKK